MLNNLIAMSSLDSPLTDGKGSPTRLAFGESNLLRVAGTSQSGVTLWDIDPETGQGDPVELGVNATDGKFYLSPDGNRLALVTEDDQVEMRVENTGEIFSITLPTMQVSTVTGQGVSSSGEETGSMDTLSFSKDGVTLAGAYCSARSRTSEPGSNVVSDICTNREILIWDISLGGLMRTISSQQSGPIPSLAFSPKDENMLAVGYQERPRSNSGILRKGKKLACPWLGWVDR